MFDVHVRLDVVTEGITVWQYTRKREEDAGHAQPWIAEKPASGSQPAKRRPRRGDHRMGVEHPH